MQPDPKQILEEFAALPEDERREVLAELLRMTRESGADGNEELLAAAEELLRRPE